MTDTLCPGCGGPLYKDGQHPALSRTDNKTSVCAECGVREALAIYYREENA